MPSTEYDPGPRFLGIVMGNRGRILIHHNNGEVAGFIRSRAIYKRKVQMDGKNMSPHNPFIRTDYSARALNEGNPLRKIEDQCVNHSFVNNDSEPYWYDLASTKGKDDSPTAKATSANAKKFNIYMDPERLYHDWTEKEFEAYVRSSPLGKGKKWDDDRDAPIAAKALVEYLGAHRTDVIVNNPHIVEMGGLTSTFPYSDEEVNLFRVNPWLKHECRPITHAMGGYYFKDERDKTPRLLAFGEYGCVIQTIYTHI